MSIGEKTSGSLCSWCGKIKYTTIIKDVYIDNVNTMKGYLKSKTF